MIYILLFVKTLLFFGTMLWVSRACKVSNILSAVSLIGVYSLFPFLGGMLGFLHQSCMLLLVLQGILLGWNIVSGASMSRFSKHGFLVDLLIISLSTFFILIALSSGSAFYDWDTFSHWGLAPKVIHDTNLLVDSSSAIAFKAYPPALSLFVVYFTIGLPWSELSAIYSANFILIVPFLLLFGGRANLKILVAALIVTIMWLGLWQGDVSKLLIDHALYSYWAVCLFGIYCQAISLKGIYGVRRIGLLFPMLYFLAMAKAMGVLFSLSLVLAFFLCNSCFGYQKKLYANTITLVGFVLGCVLIWGRYLGRKMIDSSDSHVVESVSLSFDVSQHLDMLVLNYGRYQKLVSEMWRSFVSVEVMYGYSALFVVLFVIVSFSVGFVAVGRWSVNGERDLFRGIATTIAVTVTLYYIGLGLTYIFVFEQIVAFNRYVKYIMLGCLYLLLLVVYRCFVSQKCDYLSYGKKTYFDVCLVMFAILTLNYAMNSTNGVSAEVAPILKRKIVYEQIERDIKEQIPRQSKIFIMFNDHVGDQFWMAKYSLAPIVTNHKCWSLNVKDRRTGVNCVKDRSSFISTIQGHDYLFMPWGVGRDSPLSFYASIEGNRDGSGRLFAIDKSNESISLTRVHLFSDTLVL